MPFALRAQVRLASYASWIWLLLSWKMTLGQYAARCVLGEAFHPLRDMEPLPEKVCAEGEAESCSRKYHSWSMLSLLRWKISTCVKF